MQETINVSLRECRLVTYRVLWQAGAPRGAIPAVTDAVIAAEGTGRGGFAVLRDDADTLGATAAQPVRVWTGRGGRIVDADGKHALALVPDVLDLAVAAARRDGTAEVEVRGAVRPELVDVFAALAPDHGVTASLHDEPGDGRRFTVLATGEPVASPNDRSTAAILHHGLDVTTDLWWHLFHLGNRALTPDSVVSRRHTGRSVFDEHGRIVGEMGEDLVGETTGAGERATGTG